MQRILKLAFASSALLLVLPQANAASYTLTSIEYSGASNTAITGLNNVGQAFGVATVDGVDRSFIYENGTIRDFAGPEGAISTALIDGSDNGVYVGSYSRLGADGGQVYAGFITNGSHFDALSIAGASATFVRGISPNGRYVAGFWTAHAPYSTSGYAPITVLGQGFVLDRASGNLSYVGRAAPNAMTYLGGVNDKGVVAGYQLEGYVTQKALTYDSSTGQTSFEPWGNQTAFDIDNAGHLAGSFTRLHSFEGDPFAGVPGLLAEQPYDQRLTVADFPGLASFVQGIVTGTPRLNDRIKTYFTAYGNNDAGVFGGGVQVRDTSGNVLHGVGFIATPVPEPETASMLFWGLILVALARRRVSRS